MKAAPIHGRDCKFAVDPAASRFSFITLIFRLEGVLDNCKAPSRSFFVENFAVKVANAFARTYRTRPPSPATKLADVIPTRHVDVLNLLQYLFAVDRTEVFLFVLAGDDRKADL